MKKTSAGMFPIYTGLVFSQETEIDRLRVRETGTEREKERE
jgi:hypothetical protein